MSTIPKKGPYIPFLQFEFPNYLTDELRGINMKKIREMETRLRGLQLHAVELLEEKRLRTESENFVKHVHESRLNGNRSNHSYIMLKHTSSLININNYI